jgi:hypothetical protein
MTKNISTITAPPSPLQVCREGEALPSSIFNINIVITNIVITGGEVLEKNNKKKNPEERCSAALPGGHGAPL